MHESDAILATILWRRLDQPGHEIAWLAQAGGGGRLAGTAVFAEQGVPCALSYSIQCTARWETRSLRLRGRRGAEPVDVAVDVDEHGHWRLNGAERPDVNDCTDIDLAFSPATNTLTLRRLNLAIGEEQLVTSARLDFPALTLDPLPQIYRRSGERSYSYLAPAFDFATELTIDARSLLITAYPPLWTAEAIG